MIKSKFKIIYIALILGITLLLFGSINSQQNKIGDIRDGSRATPIHLIKLFDADSVQILKNDSLQIPLSTRYTCGECHSYNVINKGFHFNYADKKVPSGRRSEPYIYMDWRKLTVIPLSYRDWKGTFNPAEIGISPMKFLDLFGTHLPGGGVGEIDSLISPDELFRMEVSGKLEVNCFACHDATRQYDPAEYSSQVQKQNYKWAPAGATSLAAVTGNASKMPENFDIYTPSTFADIDVRTTSPPAINYDLSKFNSNNMVFFDLKRKGENERCYYCHSSVHADNNYLNQWKGEEDVHIAKGMNCVDCHRNGLDHQMARGYRDEAEDYKRPELKSYTCEGCHLEVENRLETAGKNGAPKPLHKGMPNIHFEKLECTVCHSGNLPKENVELVKTSRAHKLGLHKSNKEPELFPHIQSTVFVRNENGRLEPSNIIYPSYWGIKKGDEIKPIPISDFDDSFNERIKLDTLLNYGKWLSINDSTLIEVLKYLNESSGNKENHVFITSGKVFEMNDGELESYREESADYYSWAIGHNVRPASQSLGVNGCDDCHSFSSDFFFGNVLVESSVKSDSANYNSMTYYSDLNTVYQKLFSLTFLFRPWMKIMIIIFALIIIFVFVIYVSKGIFFITERGTALSSKEEMNNV